MCWLGLSILASLRRPGLGRGDTLGEEGLLAIDKSVDDDVVELEENVGTDLSIVRIHVFDN